MADFISAIGNAVRANLCAVTSTAEGILGLASSANSALGFPSLPNSDVLPGLVAGARQATCNSPTPEVPGPPFSGGQCAGVNYIVRGTATSSSGGSVGPPQPFAVSGPGPVSGIRVQGGQQFPQLKTASVVFAGGVTSTVAAGTWPNPSTPPTAEANITSVERSDGQPDNCGDPPTPVVPYDPDDYTRQPNIEYDPAGGGPPISIQPTLIFAPVYADIDGSINVPFSINFEDGSSLFGDLNLGNNTINFGGSGNNNPSNPGVEPVPDPGGPDGDDPTPEEEEGEPIIAVYVRTTTIQPWAKLTEIFGNAQQQPLWVPRLAHVRFHCELGRDRGLGWSRDLDVKTTSCLIECPVSWGARSVEVVPYDGVTTETTIIRGVSARALSLAAAEN